MRLFIIFSFVFTLFLPLNALAETPPIPEQKKLNLEQKFKEIEGELGKTKDRLVKIGRSIQSNEKNLQGLEIKIERLEAERAQIQEDLKKDQKSISRLILALQRIKRVPPEALIAKPDAPLKTAQSAMLMGDIIPSLNRQAQALKTNLTNLENISADLEEKRARALATSEQLKEEQDKLAGLVEKRQKLYLKTAGDLEAKKKRARVISKQAKSLKDLVKRLDEDIQKTSKPSVKPAVAKVTPIPKAGKPQLPLSGIIRTSYNQEDAFGAPSKGLEIEGRGGALIVVPMGGVVRFAGHFKNYGNMIIIEHKKGYHSLIAGLEKIDTVVGQNVSAGEPLGKLHFTSNGSAKRPTLYYELRHKGEPINPAKKFTGLS